jgi:type III restriction enzyme
MQTLNEILEAVLKSGDPEFYKNQVPAFVYSNLKAGYGQRPYQQEAFGRFVFYWNEYHDRPKGIPTQLLYHMATGSGKTVIMAGLIIYLYERGYRNFLFFVNSTSIIDKTRDNFFNTASSKYLFSDTVSIGSSRIRITEAENFQAAHPDDITIIFSTIQGLHSRLTTPTENSLTYDDFEDKKIVLISDEAHHINAETKKGNELGTEEKEALLTWEGTVNRILKTNRENILLEFTATADLSLPEIQKKYSDKLIVDYPLKQFRQDGYSKEVKVLQADLPPFDRALQGVLLSQYRRKIFEKYKKQVKPVILFKSRTIQESQSFFEAFTTGIKNLKASDLEKIKRSGTDDAIKKVFHYLEANNISFENLVAELKEDFAEAKLLSINSKDESEQKQLAVNSLEDETNEYRAVFAVDKLNEGWDVLNLFDIVRLYDTRDVKEGKPGKTALSEAQLIGRGARYCPFRITKEQSFFTRKFDDDTQHELRICEELYYHSGYNPRYIQELNTALEEIGIKATQTIERPRNAKHEFKEAPFFKTELRLMNEQDRINLASILDGHLHKVTLKTGHTHSSTAFDNTQLPTIERHERKYLLADFGEHIIRKAINRVAFYQFSNLKRILPDLHSISEFITSDTYLGKVKLDVSGLPEQLNNLSPKEKLEASVKVLEEIATVLALGNHGIK